MSAQVGFAVSIVAFLLYCILFTREYEHAPIVTGRGRLYVLIMCAVLALFWATRAVGYAGLAGEWMSPVAVNHLFRWGQYILIVPAVALLLLQRPRA